MKHLASFLCRLSLLLPLFAHAAQPDCPAISLEPATLAGASINDAYTAAVTQAGSPGATFAVSAGSLPSGLTLSAGGALSGTPTQTGSFLFTATATDAASGCSGSRVYGLSVIAINHAPTFTAGGDQLVLEDAGPQSLAGWAINISAGNGDTGQALTFAVTNNTNPALFSAAPSVDAATGNLTYTPAADASGTATLTLVLRDDGGTANGGVDTSAPHTVTLTVTSVNDAPRFTKGPDQNVLEGAAPQSIAGWASAISPGPSDEASQAVTFTVSSDNPALFTTPPAIAADGTLSYALAADRNGTAIVSVTAHDDGGTANGGVDASATQTFTLTVGAVNDSPSFTKGPDQAVLEDAAPQNIAGWASAISPGPADEAGQAVTFTVTSDNPALFSAAPSVAANGTLTYALAANRNGTATVSVTAQDNGGTANSGVDTSAAQTFTITVGAVNDAPSFTKGADLLVLEDAGPKTFAGWASAISPGPADEAGQAVTFTVASDNPALFSAAPSVAADGTLSFTPAPNANGTAIVSVTAHDNGGTADGGSDTSAAQTFTIGVTSVDDAPVAVGDAATVDQDSSANPIDVLANDADIDGGAKLVASVTQPANGTVAITGGGTGLTYTPNTGYSNTPPAVPADTFTYTLNGGSTATVAVTVTPVSTDVDVGAYHINGTCGILGVQGPGFLLTAGPTTPLPVGTTILVNASGIANSGVFSVTGGTASVTVLSATSRLITLTAPLPAGQTLTMRTTLSISVAFTLNATTTLPTGYIGTGGKPAGSVNSTLVLCSAN